MTEAQLHTRIQQAEIDYLRALALAMSDYAGGLDEGDAKTEATRIGDALGASADDMQART